jgi:hypothetical protein
VLENIPFAAWQNRNKGVVDDKPSDPLGDTSLRRFKQGTVLNYGLTIFNAKTAGSQQPSLTSRIKIFLDGKTIFEGLPQPIPPRTEPRNPGTVSFAGSLSLASKMAPGEYVLQITVTDNLAKEKQKTANQFVQFEVIE